MVRPDPLLTGSIMAMIAIALVFDDDEEGPRSTPSDDESLFGPETTENGTMTSSSRVAGDRSKKP
jgi:hypothetical protein